MHRSLKELYLKIAEGTASFNSAEIEILDEVLTDHFDNPKTTYILFEEKDNDKLLGFAIFGRSPMTKFSWDIYWMAVDKGSQRKGIGQKLQERIEGYVLGQDKKANLIIETSSKPEYDATRSFYLKKGFKEMGQIPDFYKEDDSLVIFYKSLITSK
ncbi:MAG: GNAT family N-acetyltransferase [bacterium]|nr:GNAT family N-acetyltransferase [bacterium]